MNLGRMTIVVGSNNVGKLAELRTLVADLPVDLMPVGEVVPEMAPVVEDGTTFEQNAIKKARAVADACLMVTLADDSGLEVESLQGQPGVRSARFAGDRATDAENNAALLQALEEVPEEARDARFRCVLCLVDPWAPGGPGFTIEEGLCGGKIARSPRGGGGFGYDPLFVVTEYGRTMAELTEDEKNAISHRGRAMRAMRKHLEAILAERMSTVERISLSGPPPAWDGA